MEVWYLETYYSEDEKYDQILIHLPNTDYWFGTYGYENYDDIESIPWSNFFWESVELKQNDLLTYLGEM